MKSDHESEREQTPPPGFVLEKNFSAGVRITYKPMIQQIIDLAHEEQRKIFWHQHMQTTSANSLTYHDSTENKCWTDWFPTSQLLAFYASSIWYNSNWSWSAGNGSKVNLKLFRWVCLPVHGPTWGGSSYWINGKNYLYCSDQDGYLDVLEITSPKIVPGSDQLEGHPHLLWKQDLLTLRNNLVQFLHR